MVGFFSRKGGKRLLAKRLAGIIDGRATHMLLRALYGRNPGGFCATTHTLSEVQRGYRRRIGEPIPGA